MVIAFSVLAIVTNCAKKFLELRSSPQTFKRWMPYFPLYAVMFIPFTISPDLAVATFMGTLAKFVWEKVDGESAKLYAISCGAGLMTGGSIAGVVIAILNIANVTEYLIIPYFS